jgi:hypothetical protein
MLVRQRGAGGPARLGSEALSLADPMEPPRSFVTGRNNGSEVTRDRLGLSRGPPARQPARRADRARLRLYQTVPLRMERTLLRLEERNHGSIRVLWERTHSCAKHPLPDWQALED